MTRTELKDRVFLQMAFEVSRLGTCARRKVGCFLLDKKYRVKASGYNGTPSGAINCTDSPCKGAHYPSGQGLDQCEAIHAEQNALIQLTDPESVHTVICTTAPCLHCVKMLANTSAMRIVFGEDYPHSEASKTEWLKKPGREWVHLTPDRT